MTRLALLLLALAATPAFAQADASAPGPDGAAVEAAPAPRRPTSLFADLRAYQAGDLLTVVLAERTSARRRSERSSQASADVSAAGSGSVGGFFGLDAQVGGRRDADSRTVQSDLLTGTITARVVAVDAAGNLQIEGERRLNVDGDTHLMTVSGLVRPADVSPSNTVLSHQIAGADVLYAQEASGSKFLSGRFLTTVGTVVVLLGAVLMGGSAVAGQ